MSDFIASTVSADGNKNLCSIFQNDTTVFDRYTHSVYRAMSHMVSIGYGHVMPQSTTEIWLTILSMMLGATFYAIFIGHISSFVMSLNYSGRKYEEKVSCWWHLH